MKKVKFLMFALAIAAILSSCTENAISPATDQTLSASQVPSAVQATLVSSFPTATATTWSKASPTVYQASFQANAKSMLASINSGGTMLYSHTQIDPATLPSSIITYLDTNYAGYAIKKAGSKTDSAGAVQGYLVVFSLNNLTYEIRFDASGAFLSLEVGDGSKQCSEITKAELPAAIITYLDSAYTGYLFNHAKVNKTNGTVSGYGVEITYNSAKVRLLFDASGKFLSLDDKEHKKGDGKGKGGHGRGGSDKGTPTPVDQANLLSAITTYLNSNYSGYTFVGAVSFSDGTSVKGYEVKISYQNKTYELEFDAAGNFVKVH